MDELDSRRFGRYLRRVREDRKLSLDAVEEMTTGYPDRVTKSHLSRIENGSAVPSFGKMFALSQVYGIPIAALAERFEMDLLREMAPVETPPTSARAVQRLLEQYKLRGDYAGGLNLLTAVRAEVLPGLDESAEKIHELEVYEVDFLAHLARYEFAKVRCEEILGAGTLTRKQRLQVLMTFIICCYRLGRFTIAHMAMGQVENELKTPGHPPKLEAMFASIQAVVLTALGQDPQAIEAYKRAIELYRALPDPFETCKAQINLGQVLIDTDQVEQAVAQLRSALKVAVDSKYDKLTSLAMSHLAVASFRKDDVAATESYALRSNAIARPREYLTVVFRNCYYLRSVALRRGDAVTAKQNERTLKSYLSRVDPELPELVAFRTELAGGRQ